MYLTNSKSKILLACIYRKQEVSCSIFCEELDCLLEKVFAKGDIIILVGDFNVWVDIEDDVDAVKLMPLMSAYGFTQLIREPTHIAGHTLDHVYVNIFQIELEYEVVDRSGIITDHYPIIIKLPTMKQQIGKKTITFRKTKGMDVEKLKAELQDVYEKIDVTANTDFSSSYSSYVTSTEKLVEKYAPLITRTVSNRQSVPWMDEEFRTNRSKRRKLEREWKKNKTNENRKKYIDQRKLCADMSIMKQKVYYSNLVETNKTNQNSLFKIVNNVLDNNKTRTLPDHSDPVQLANEFNKYYIEKVENLRKTIPPATEKVDIPIDKFEGTVLDIFQPTTEEEIEELITECGIKTSTEDPIPADILKLIIDEALPCLTMLVNKSLAEGSMDGVKQSVIDPLLKKSGLDSDNKNNYRPVNNLVFFSKLVERVVLRRLDSHMTVNNLHCDAQFGYKKYHSTETMMLGMMNDVLNGFDDNKCTIILFLDLSAAFDTIDIEQLLNILSEEIGVRGLALKWFRSFLTGRTQRVKINNNYSSILEVLFGVPQGSVIGPKLFNINVRGLPNVFQKLTFKAASFADDSNGMKTFSLTFQYEILKNEVVNCMEEVVNWMNIHFMKINPDKTEILLLYPKSLQNKVIIKGTIFREQCIRFSNEVKNVGVWLDKHLNLDKHVNHIVSHCYKLLKDIGRIRNILSKKHTETLVHAVISSRLDYCNSLYFNMSKSNLYKLQKVQNAAARLVMQKNKRQSTSGMLKGLHWLQVESRIIFKILLIVFKCVIGNCSNNLRIKYKMHNCRPNDYLMLKTPSCKTKYGERTFDFVGPRLWNALPLYVRMESSIEQFKKHVKTILFDNTQTFKQKAFQYT